MNDLLTTSVFARWYELLFNPPVSVSLSQEWGVSIDEVHTQLLSWALFAVFVQSIVIVFLCRRFINALWKFVRRHCRGFILTSAVIIGSLIPDVDHFLTNPYTTSYGKGYGHIVGFPLVVLLLLAFTYLGRCYKTRILGRH